MAEKTIRVDDIDGSEGADVVKRDFSLLDRDFHIDLSDENHKRLEEALETLDAFLEVATEVRQASTRGKKEATSKLANGHTNTDVRKWAGENGIEVSVRGKIGQEVYDQYYEAFPDAKPE